MLIKLPHVPGIDSECIFQGRAWYIKDICTPTFIAGVQKTNINNQLEMPTKGYIFVKYSI